MLANWLFDQLTAQSTVSILTVITLVITISEKISTLCSDLLKYKKRKISIVSNFI